MPYNCKLFRGICVVKMGILTWDQILVEVVCISQSTNTLGIGMNPTILLPVMGK